MYQPQVIQNGILASSILASLEKKDFELFEPKRVEISPLTLCMLADDDDLFGDLD